MPNFPTYCEHCGHIWAGNQIHISGNISGLVMKNNKTNCPSCGKLTPMLDGTFDLEDGVLTLRSGPQITKDKIRSMIDFLSTLDSERVLDEEIGQAIDEVSTEPNFYHRSLLWLKQNGMPAVRTVNDLTKFFETIFRIFG